MHTQLLEHTYNRASKPSSKKPPNKSKPCKIESIMEENSQQKKLLAVFAVLIYALKMTQTSKLNSCNCKHFPKVLQTLFNFILRELSTTKLKIN